MRKLVIAAAALLCACRSDAQPTPAPSGAPRLLVVISVDQFAADLFDEYRPQFTGGLARLASGTVFRNGYQSHATTETCPGHSTLLTGDRPARTGIINNYWVDQSLGRSDVTIYCAEDERVPGSSSAAYTVSPVHLRVPTLGELMKARWPAARNVAVSGKDRAAVMMGGHDPDQRWFWNGKKFATDLAAATAPPGVARANVAVANALAAAQPPLAPPPFCAAKAQPIALPGGLTVGNGAFARASGDAAAFRASPQFDGAVLALAAALVGDLRLGSGPAPDLLSIGLSATDYVGHRYGAGGQEMCLQLLSLDRDLGDFFAFLDRSRIDYSVVLAADHGASDIPERLRLHGVTDAARVDPALSPTEVGKALGAKLGLAGPVLLGSDFYGDVWVDEHLESADRVRALREALALYRAHPQVAAAYSREQVARTPSPAGDPVKWSLLERARASFDAERSGDIILVLKPHVMPIPVARVGYAATHGSPWDYDRRVPILFWRPGMPSVTRQEAVETVDIMPTLAAMIGVGIAPGAVDGKCLAGVPGAACPAPAAASNAERGNR
jgi:predicted AlkP superfamily pyrophosphatase or phosphodiesterase